jgi:hypothetical protein
LFIVRLDDDLYLDAEVVEGHVFLDYLGITAGIVQLET